MNQETDEKVRVRAILDRRPGAFEALVHDYQKLCWHIVYRMVGQDDAPDLCQETFLRVHRLLHQFRFGAARGDATRWYTRCGRSTP